MLNTLLSYNVFCEGHSIIKQPIYGRNDSAQTPPGIYSPKKYYTAQMQVTAMTLQIIPVTSQIRTACQ